MYSWQRFTGFPRHRRLPPLGPLREPLRAHRRRLADGPPDSCSRPASTAAHASANSSAVHSRRASTDAADGRNHTTKQRNLGGGNHMTAHAHATVPHEASAACTPPWRALRRADPAADAATARRCRR
jgi:hypothetical protein